MRKLTQEEFIERATEVHNGKYDYSKVEYKNAQTKVVIICPIHGEFWQSPNNHLHGHGCNKCANEYSSKIKKKEHDVFIKQLKGVYGNKYTFNNVKYTSKKEKVSITCPIHGDFLILPSNALKGRQCPKCSKHYMDTEYFIYLAKNKHGDKYDYSKTKYTDCHTPVCVICPIHGEIYIKAHKHLNSCGCTECAIMERGEKRRSETKEFIDKARKVHGEKYDYSEVEYICANKKVKIICPEHGEFWQTPNGHLYGRGCSKCANHSRGEEKVSNFLLKKRINFIPQYKIKIGLLNEVKVDFYIELNEKYIIEFNGIQHYKKVPYFHRNEEAFKLQLWRDKQLEIWCKENNINLIIIRYNEINNIDKILTNFFKKIL